VRRTKIDFSTVRELGLAMPGVEEGTTYGSPALKLRGRLLACLATHRSAEPGSLVVCVTTEHRDELVAADPETYYFTEHYANYGSVLVRLHRIHRDALRDLLLMSWRVGSRKPARRRLTPPVPAAKRGHPVRIRKRRRRDRSKEDARLAQLGVGKI
jgi:hypothetical protein